MNLFGLLAGRLLRMSPGHDVPEGEVGAAQREAQAQYEQQKQLFTKNIEDYNTHYGDNVEAAYRMLGNHYESIDLKLDDLSAMEAQMAGIQGVMIKEKTDAGIDWRQVLPNDPQFKALGGLRQLVVALQQFPQQKAEAVEGTQRGRLARRHELMTQSKDARELWEKQPAYKELSGVFDSLSTNDAFKGLWQTTEGGLSSQKQREAKQLFFAIMAEKTDGFKDNFVLGPEFGNDPETNIRNFPYMYNEFLKIQGGAVADAVSLEKLAAAQSGVNLAEANLKTTRSTDDILKSPGISDAGINPAELKPVPVMPDTDGWGERKNVLTRMAFQLEQKAKDAPNLPQTSSWVTAARELRMHVAYADACVTLSRLKDRERLVQSKFTRTYLSEPPQRKLAMELAMRQFAKAIEMVDRGPFNISNWQNALHPTVRRMLIASLYDNGVGAYKTDASGIVTYQENTSRENMWMMSALSLSDYFNQKEVGEAMDADHEAVLKAAYLSSRIAVLMEDAQPTVNVLQAWITVREKLGAKDPRTWTEEDKKFVQATMGPFPPELVARFEKYTLDELKNTQTGVKKNLTILDTFLQDTKFAIQHPYDQKSKNFIKSIREDQYKGDVGKAIDELGTIPIVSGANLEGYLRQMYNLQINFKTAELQDQNMLMFFEGMGMNIEGIYPAYLNAIKKDPHLKAEYWDTMLLGEDPEFNKLIALFKQIIPDSAAGGKDDFIAGLQTLRRKYKGQKNLSQILSEQQEGSEDAAILNVYRLLQQHLALRGETYAASDRQQKEVEAKMKGLHVGDEVAKYVGGVWNMLTGPGQSMANRAAGLVLMYGFYKSARMAMKGEGRAGKAMRGLFVAGAIEIATKELTGRGILDRLGLDDITKAMEGTYEAVLLQDGEARMKQKEIKPQAHAEALMRLNSVPFNQIMEWYENSDENGMPMQKGQRVADKLPPALAMHLVSIAEHNGMKSDSDVRNLRLEGRRILHETVAHFFAYVGDKDNHHDANYGKEALRERWITMLKERNNPNYKPKYSTYDHREWLQAGNIQPQDLTWQVVSRAEIDPDAVFKTRNRSLTGRLETTAREWYSDLSDWTREYVYNPGSGYAEEFFGYLGERSQDAKKFFEEVAKTTERKIYFAKESAILWYGEHQYEIKRVAENHWQLLVTAVKMPFKLVAAIDNFAIPWTLTEIKRVEEILSSTREDPVDHDLTAADIGDERTLDSTNPQINPGFSRFGVYQEGFYSTFRPKRLDAAGHPIPRPDGTFERLEKRGERFYEDPGEHIGYYISEMTEREAGINPGDPRFTGHPDAVRSKMVEASRNKAIKKFLAQGMERTEIDAYLDLIHTYVKTTEPKKVYAFWRMPLRNSAELELKESGHWADYMHAEQIKDRPAFTVDPSQTTWENLERGFMLGVNPETRTLIATGGRYVAQIPRFAFGNFEVAGYIIKAIAHRVAKKAGPDTKKEIDGIVDSIMKRSPAQRQFIDESFTSGSSEHLALSNFYKDPTNAKLFRFCFDYATHKRQPLFLGIMKGRKGLKGKAYEGMMYLEDPSSQPGKTYQDMWQYYQDNYAKGAQADPDIEAAIQAAMTGKPAPAPHGHGRGHP